jgi:hypothetical protein
MSDFRSQPMTATDKPCTCHPSDAPPVPCPRQFALTHCKAAAYDSLKARIAELEANEKAYEEIIGKKTYRQVADRIQEMEGALQKISDLVESEAGEPLDDAIKIANDALQPKDTAP